jgi:hypothetical protein
MYLYVGQESLMELLELENQMVSRNRLAWACVPPSLGLTPRIIPFQMIGEIVLLAQKRKG